MKKGKKGKKEIPLFKKSIKDFLFNEEGKIAEKDIAKIGISLVVLSSMFLPAQVGAYHANQFVTTGEGGHVSHSSHASHGSHGSHCSSKMCW